MWKKLISLFLVICMLVTMVGCGGGNPVVPTDSEEPTEDIVFVQNTNPEDNVLAVAGKAEGEVLAILGEKDAFGNPIKITGAVYTSEQGEAFIIDAGDDGLPTYILDSTGNKVVFINYTDSTVEISIYNSNNELIEGPITITVDPADLAELKQLYSSVDLKNKDAADVVAFVLKWGGFGLNWATCVVAAFSLVVPAIVYACGSAVLSTVAMFTPTDTDNLILSNIGVIQCAFAFKPWEIVACAWSIISYISEIIEIINQDNDENENHPPVISSLNPNPSSVDISQTTIITCSASDPDGDPLTYHWTKNGGAFVGSTSGPSVTWRAPSTPGTYRVYCEVSDGEGGEDNNSANIIVTESDEDKIRSICSKVVSALNNKNWNKARSYCINGSEAYNQVSELENSINNIENWYGPGNLNINSNINNIVVNGNYATVYGYFNSTFTAGSYFDENSGSFTGYLKKSGSSWKIYEGVIPNL